VNSRIPPIKLTDDNGAPLLDKDGKQIVLPASAWLDRFKPVEQMTWVPGQPTIIDDKLIFEGGWIDRAGCTCFNLYHPPTIIPGVAARASKWLDHVRYVFPDEADHILNWLAHRVQRPQDKINHALVLGGAQGIGKDTMLEPVKYAVGPWNFQEVSPTQILGRFNGFLKSVILRVSEARDLGEFDRFQLYDHMKAFTAAPPDVLRIDEKHLRAYSIVNCCGVIVTTNHKTDGIFLPATIGGTLLHGPTVTRKINFSRAVIGMTYGPITPTVDCNTLPFSSRNVTSATLTPRRPRRRRQPSGRSSTPAVPQRSPS
jgi:hypothetical protein